MTPTWFGIPAFCIAVLCAWSAPADEPAAGPNCGVSEPPNQEIYRIIWEGPAGTRQRLWISRFPKYAVVVFRSAAGEDGDWAAELAALEFFSYRESAEGSGRLVTKLRDREDALVLGPISKLCWDGLRHHLGDRVVMTELDSR